MSATEAKKAADRRYRDNMKQIAITVKPDVAQAIKDEAAIEGVSVTQYILSCHAEHIARKDKR